MGQSVVVVDAFADRPFRGNPAAICVTERPVDDAWMQSVAAEMNLSETAFLHSEGSAYRLRWFTPLSEVDLCGHATLASAHVLWEAGHLDSATPAEFETRSGRLTARRDENWIELDFPALPPEPAEAPPELLAALDRTPQFVGRNRFDYLVVLDSAEAVRRLAPDFTRLKEVVARGVIVTARDEGVEFDFVSRFFAPRLGVDEDPVCGSAHCCLAPFWSERLERDRLMAYQASPRGGVLRLAVEGDRVRLAGQAVTVLRGELPHAS